MTQAVQFGDLSFQLRRSGDRTTVGITVDRDGSLILAAPPKVELAELERFVRQKEDWIYDKLRKKQRLLQASPPPREYVNGEGFWYLGRSHRLKIVEPSADTDPLRLHRGRFELHEDHVDEGPEVFKAWYREHLKPRVERLSDEYARRLHTEHGGVSVQQLGHRWGSCGKNDRLNYHWRTALLPRGLIEYVVAHEVAHIVEEGHGQRFWRLVERLLPDYEERRERLAKEGARYDL